MSDGEGHNETQKHIHGLLDFYVDNDADTTLADSTADTSKIADTTAGSIFGAVNLDISRRSAFGDNQKDLVGILGHGKFEDPMGVRFIENKVGRKRTYSIKSNVCPQIVHLGAEEPKDGAFDYVMAVVNKRTRAVEYRQVKVLRFEARHTEDRDALFRDEPQKTNYDLDNSTARDEFMNQRRALTAQFGSSRSIKIQEQALNRKINDGTLDAMNATTLNNVKVNTDVVNDELIGALEGKGSDINLSLLNNGPIGDTLPPAVEDTEIPSMVYPTSIFVSAEDVENYSEDALKYLDQKIADLVSQGMPKCLLRFKAIAKDPERAVLLVMLATMINFCQGIGRFKANIHWNPIVLSGLPESLIQFVRHKFFKGDIAPDQKYKKKLVLAVDEQEKEKIVAWTLCLGLILDPSLSCPLTPFATDLKIVEGRLVKVLTALGCTLTQASHSEAINLNTTRVARLQGPPSKLQKRFVRGRGGKR